MNPACFGRIELTHFFGTLCVSYICLFFFQKLDVIRRVGSIALCLGFSFAILNLNFQVLYVSSKVFEVVGNYMFSTNHGKELKLYSCAALMKKSGGN